MRCHAVLCVGAKITKDKHGIVFDVPNDKVSIIEEQWRDKPFATLAVLKDMPEYLEEDKGALHCDPTCSA